jgi:NADPH-dependent 2,4-dienoyl-CoA reductase/sulfur reductase-like enzyme
MECARLAAQSGHDVTLLDAGDQLGGTITAARSAPHREEFGAIADWQQRQLGALPVRVELATAATLELIQSRQPDVVVVATGAAVDPVGAEDPVPVPADQLCDVLAVLDGRRPGPGEGAVVLDHLGGYPAVAAAETLARDGHAVTIVTGFEQFGPALGETYELVPSLKRLTALGVDVLTSARVTKVAAKLVTVEHPAGDAPIQVDATLVCLAGARTPAPSSSSSCRSGAAARLR